MTLELRGERRIPGRWDRLRLEQIVTNLVSNAIRFGNGKPIVVQLGVHEPVRAHGHRPGNRHPREQARHDLQPFERAVPERHYGGLGLGLYIVRTIATRLGGTVEVHSSIGNGTTFVVTLPREVGA